jgi:succinate dehydrogenase / fumarate reductase cytochrome b subunit
MLVSILHRASGDGLAFVGLPVLLWWLYAIANGPEAYATFTSWMWADLGALEWGWPALAISFVKALLKIVMVGLSWAFFNHLCSGIRHFVLDMGAGYEVDTNNRWSVMTTVGGIVLTAAFWAVLVLL